MNVLGAKAPAASLPEGAILNGVTRSVVVASETIGKLDSSSSTSLAKYHATFQSVFSFFYIGWPLSGENTWDPIITGGKEEGRGGRGTCGKEVLLEAGAVCTGSKVPFHYK